MSRSGYSDDCENVELWRTTVRNAINGKRGQAFLRDLIASLDAMPTKELIVEELVTPDGQCCALGAVALKRGIDVSRVDPEDRERVAQVFDIAPCMAAEIAYENDECTFYAETPEKRWRRMRGWAEAHLKRGDFETKSSG